MTVNDDPPKGHLWVALLFLEDRIRTCPMDAPVNGPAPHRGPV